MVKQHSQILSLLIGVCDLATIAVAWAGSYVIRFHFLPSPDGLPSPRNILSNLSIALLVSLVVLAGIGLYKPRRDKSFLLEIGQILKAATVIWGLLIVLIYYTTASPFTRGMLAIFLPCMMAGLILERGIYRSALRALRRRGWNLRHALVIGTGRLAQSTMMRLHRNSWTGIRVAGFIDIGIMQDGTARPQKSEVRGLPIVGTTETLLQTIETMKVDCVFVALPTQHAELLRRVVGQLEETSVDVRIVPDLFLSRFPTNVTVGELDGLPILTLRENPLAGWPSIYKRVFDVFGALFGLTLLSLPLLCIAVVIKLHDRGPIFYRQRRISYGRRAFNMIKFRTMVSNAEGRAPPSPTAMIRAAPGLDDGFVPPAWMNCRSCSMCLKGICRWSDRGPSGRRCSIRLKRKSRASHCGSRCGRGSPDGRRSTASEAARVFANGCNMIFII